ncbi:MAG: hypothetical protein ABSG67_10965 [Thermoguttaceae bacterium]|jgi:hypothetical protein
MPNKTNPDRCGPAVVAAKLVFPPSSLYLPPVNFPIIPAVWFKQTGATQELTILPTKPETQKPQTIPIKHGLPNFPDIIPGYFA